jgi:hypothetical protein
MKKVIISVILIAMGIYTFMWWGAGAHGQIRFRPHMLEDWILSSIVLICFGIPLFILIRHLKNKP